MTHCIAGKRTRQIELLRSPFAQVKQCHITLSMPVPSPSAQPTPPAPADWGWGGKERKRIGNASFCMLPTHPPVGLAQVGRFSDASFR